MFWFFLWILWLIILFRVIADIFRDDSSGVWGKTGWLSLVIKNHGDITAEDYERAKEKNLA